MVILTEQKLNLFEDIRPIKFKDDSKAYPYRIDSRIEYDNKKHKRLFDFINNKIVTQNEITPEYLSAFYSDVMIEIELPDNNNILAAFDDKIYTKNDIDLIYYNIYHSLVNKKIVQKDKSYIEAIEYNLNSKDFHWVWFRVGVSYLNPKIIKRALSWIRMNPEIQFHLWTNLSNESYCEDFFSQIPQEELKEFRARTTIHFKNEMMNLLKEFCEHSSVDKLHILNFLISVMSNIQDRSSMIFKTDLLRAIILYLRGGWYSDFNDTYCFTQLKYLINPEASEAVYLGSDYTENIYNNYIIYVPKESTLWLANVYKIIACSINLYKILETKEDEFASIIRAMFKSFGKILKDANGRNILDLLIPRIPFWLKIINESITKLFKKYNVFGIEKIEINISKFIIFFKNILNKEYPESPMVKRLNEEFAVIKNVVTIKDILFPVWSKKPETPYIAEEYDINYWSKYNINKTTIYNTLIDVTYHYFMHLNNIGRFFINMNVTHGVNLIPYCYVYENFCFLTSLCHMGDATCCGRDRTYNDVLI